MSRIYLVTNNQTGEEKLVEAGLPAQVLRHVAKSLFKIEAVKQPKLVELLLAGQKPEKASEDADDKPQAGTAGADATSGADASAGQDAQSGADASAVLAEGSVQEEAQAQEGFQADAGTEAQATGRKRR